jgi:hypothetical protein
MLAWSDSFTKGQIVRMHAMWATFRAPGRDPDPFFCSCVAPSDNLGWSCIQADGVCQPLVHGECVAGTTACIPAFPLPTRLKACKGCFGTSFGPCIQANGVCHFPVNGECVYGTTPCRVRNMLLGEHA